MINFNKLREATHLYLLKNGKKQRDLCADLACTQTSISEFLNEKTNFPNHRIKDLCDVIGENIEQFIEEKK